MLQIPVCSQYKWPRWNKVHYCCCWFFLISFYFFIFLWKIGLVVMSCCWIPDLFSLFCLLEKNEELLHEDLSFSLSSDDSISEFSLTDVSSDELFSEPEVVQLTGKH